MKITALLFVLLVLLSCSSEDSLTAGEQKEFLTDSPVETDSTGTFYASFTDEISRTLEKYFTPELLTRLDQYVLRFNELGTDADFGKSYEEGRALYEEIYNAFYEPQTHYLRDLKEREEYWMPISLLDEIQELNGHLGPINLSCKAECTELDVLFDLAVMKEKARETKGKADDDFMDLVIFIEDGEYGYAGYPGFKVWYAQTWDYGGYSLLGNGDLTEAIKRTRRFEEKHALFAGPLEAIRQDFVNELTNGQNYGLPKEQVLKEFDQILEMDYFTDEEIQKMQELYQKIQSGAKDLQFDCETGDCSYG